jgi:hypothetical protein
MTDDPEIPGRLRDAENRALIAGNAVENIKREMRLITETFGIRRSFNGQLSVDFAVLVKALGDRCHP